MPAPVNLTVDQIAAGAAILSDAGQPIGRNTAIMVADAMGVRHSEADLPAVDQADIDKHLDAVLRASGSALRHYSMPKMLDDMRAAMRAALARRTANGAGDI